MPSTQLVANTIPPRNFQPNAIPSKGGSVVTGRISKRATAKLRAADYAYAAKITGQVQRGLAAKQKAIANLAGQMAKRSKLLIIQRVAA